MSALLRLGPTRCRRRLSLAASASRSDRPVRVRKTSSRVGPVHLDRVEGDAGGVEVAQQAGNGPSRALHPAADPAAVDLDVAVAVAERAEPLGGLTDPVEVGDLEVDEVAGHLGLEVVGGVGGDDAALVDDDDAVAQGVGLVEVVGGEEHRGSALGAHVGDVPPQVGPGLRIEAGGGLVEEDQRRVVDEAHGDVETPLLPARQRLRRCGSTGRRAGAPRTAPCRASGPGPWSARRACRGP